MGNIESIELSSSDQASRDQTSSDQARLQELEAKETRIQANRALIESYYQALAAGDFDTVTALHHDDVVYNMLGATPVSGRWVGKKACLEEMMGDLLMNNMEMDLARWGKKWRIMSADENCVVGIMQGGGPAKNGERYDQTYCEVFTLMDNKIIELHAFYDTVLVELCLNHNSLQKLQREPENAFDF